MGNMMMTMLTTATLLLAWALTVSSSLNSMYPSQNELLSSATIATFLVEHPSEPVENRILVRHGKPGRCLKDIKEVTPRKFFQLENDILNITLESSNRPGHQLVTTAFRIFLEEVLGYDSVSVKTYRDNYNATVVLQRLMGGLGDHDRTVPDTMVNLALWVPPDVELEEWTSPGHVENCGHLGFPGRFGWFIPKSPVTAEHPTVDYWRTFHNNPKLASLFSLSGDDLTLALDNSKDPATGRYYCEESYCDEGIFEPEKCKSSRRHQKGHQCAVLLASYPESSHFLTNQTQDLDLHVKIMYLGPNLEHVVHKLAAKYRNSSNQSVMFFDWKPSLITSDLDLISISFQACNSPSQSDLYCNYESRKLEKIVWGKLKSAKAAFEAVHRISFTQDEYLKLLNLYKSVMRRNSKATIEQIACQWMKLPESRAMWRNWRSSPDDRKTKLYIGGIFPMNGAYVARGIPIAADMAVKAVNKNESLLQDYELELQAHDGQCRADMVMKSFIDYILLPSFPHMVGFLGPACSDTVEPLAGVTRHFRTVVISYSAEGSSFSDREKYPYFFRTIGENKQYQYVYLRLFQEMGWERVATLTEEGQKYAEYVTHMHDLLHESGITMVSTRKFPRDRTARNTSQYLQELKVKKAKIIIGDFYDHTARSVMCEAFHQKMTGREGYVWFLPTWFDPQWYNTDLHNSNLDKESQIPCNTSEMIQAIGGHLALQYAYFGPDEFIMQENITVKKWRQQYEDTCNGRKVEQSDYAGYAYDAVWTYAYALERLLKQNHSHIADLHSVNTTHTFVQMLNETDFHGVSGHIKFVGGPSRVSEIHVVQWIDNKKHIVGHFHPLTANLSNDIIGGTLHLNKSAIVWLTADGSEPNDGKEPPIKCVLETLATTLDVTCEVAIVIANVIGFGILGLVLVMCFMVIKRRYDRRVQATNDYFKALGIDLLSATSVSALGKWEIPRDRVVINRKLGEGAFGTVYGGECFFDEKGWVAVAVKTLKVGSSCEQKLDFLSEAEVMKKFEHKNIIKLLGVCTKSEPVYTIMEFMLYGDLKTYLLARRHLVNERNCEESDEISSKRLTSMTLDVARALSYLAELKYVHRDVACRNCLVNLSRVVKLGDFGMTRPMYENDYYRFNRKGMLPVRWMSPESLALGIFTPMSDVWSFGVLLYEIVTFGSFPFQGLSNNQVLEQVKSGATISIPAGVKPQLEGLLRSCWALDPARRPHASEIVEFLANNPRIVSPCLDMPLASVQLEGTDQLEIQIPDRLRKATSKSVSKSRVLRSLSEKESNGLNSPAEIIPLSPNGDSQNHSSPYATLQHESDLI